MTRAGGKQQPRFIPPREYSDSDFTRLIANQTEDELRMWFIYHKLHHPQLGSVRQQQLEKYVPGWTWEFTPEESDFYSALPENQKEMLRQGLIPVKPPTSVSLNEYFSRIAVTPTTVAPETEQQKLTNALRAALRKRGFTAADADCVHVYIEDGRYKVKAVALSSDTIDRMVPILVDAGLMKQPVKSPHREDASEVTLSTGSGKTMRSW
jgi:hypothetical protein